MTDSLTPDTIASPAAPDAPTDLDAIAAGGAVVPPVPDAVDPALATAAPEDTPEAPAAEPEPETPEGEAEPDATPVLAVEIPHFRPDQPPLNLEGVPQEAADAMRFHIKRSASVPRLEEAVTAAQEDVATVQFLREHPTEGLFMLEKLAPQAAIGFVRSWLERYPEQAAKLVTDLRYDQFDAVDPYTVQTRARAAQMEAAQRTEQGAAQYQKTAQEQRFVAESRAVLTETLATLQLDATSPRARIFRQVAADAMAEAYQANPRITADGLRLALQDTIAEFQRQQLPAGKTLTLKPPALPPRDPKGQFTHATKVAQTARKLAPGVQPINATPTVQAPRDGTLYDLITPR